MNITEFSIKNNVLTLTLVVLLGLIGFQTYEGMPRDSMPPFTVRYVSIITTYPGGSPERVEMLVTDKVEKQLQQVSELKYIKSESRNNVSIITIEIKEMYTEMQPIYDKIRRRVDEVKPDLPDGCKVQIKDEDIVDVFGVIYSITGDGYSYKELYDIAKDVKDGLIKLPNAARVEIVGEQMENVFIEFDNAAISKYGLTTNMVKNAIANTNIIFPGGDVKFGTERIILEPTGSFESVNNISKVVIQLKDGKSVHLGDIARIRRGYKTPAESIVTVSGQPAISLGVKLKDGGNIVELGKEIDEKIKYYQEQYPWGIEFTRSASADLYVESSVDSFVSNLLQSVATVLVVMFIFLGFRTGLVVSALIPSTIVITFVMMGLLDVGLNQISLAALIMALGMLVDNAIVMSESIMVKMERGEKVYKAAIESAQELMVPLLISTLTTSAAFLAFYLAKSTMGEIVGPIFVVITIALVSSWVMSITLIPLLAIYLIKVKPKDTSEGAKESNFDKLVGYYRPFLIWNLKRPFLFIGVIFLCFLSMTKIAPYVPFIFMPDSDRALVTVNLELPMTSDITVTEEVVEEVDRYLKRFLLKKEEVGTKEGVIDFTSYVGEGAPKYDLGYQAPEKSSYTAHILINTTSNEFNQTVIDSLDWFCFNHFPDLQPRIKRLGSAGGAENPIEVRISGRDPLVLYNLVDSVKERLAGIPGTKNIKDDWGIKTKKFVIKIDQDRAENAGVTNQDIALSMLTSISGVELDAYREDDESIPIMMKDAHEGDYTMRQLESINIYSQGTGNNVPLKQVADILVDWQFTKVKRYDLFKTITVSSGVDKSTTSNEIMSELKPWLEENQKNWSTGYFYDYGGDIEKTKSGIGSVVEYLPLSFCIIVLLLVGQFNSFKKSLIILLTIPMGAIGVYYGLFLANSYMGFFGFLGLVSLAGIVINNGIVLIDRIEIELTENNREPADAIVSAATERFRPILLTTATTVCGLLPLWFGGGIMFEPLAVSLLFGLLFATVLTLVLVPVFYSLFYRVKFKDYKG
ncbi:efflux RND transporter permease subunit [Flammeovirga kamogawensis]|uniref:Efflux RND transporter permease subunit n=1 Tax=Flammeovirga kamogawensis TaxID=373891 RepID=A0ABX8H0C8_9BACT|nr:efflux RND transporter permease subunit [Flammeovirga kamogawensis]MBB6462278.1 multidrug efflux pump subunit AcrB [Flammeovirga kamogawensis]QWG09328.1 efflux RND transporter permease subunit [Flammeovirga kamogawensis]TRX64850.1 efflux RND transporter permease subunit [Flammeovirga kamogawensis]